MAKGSISPKFNAITIIHNFNVERESKEYIRRTERRKRTARRRRKWRRKGEEEW